MESTCIACKNSIKESAFRCQHCNAYQLKYPIVQPLLFSLGVLSLVLPLLVIAFDIIQELRAPKLDIEVLSANGKRKEIVIAVKNDSRKDAIVYHAQYEVTGNTYPVANLDPVVIKANSITTIPLNFNSSIGNALNFSSFRSIDDEYFRPNIKDKVWGDNETCTLYVVVREDRRVAKKVSFQCVR
ncbi:hypothetical protein [Vibrio furnissii]|uniref:hypothetical protein n=1 Tax=Vibrio furnissii TaxID=29494 RepID=UPI0025724230|nr:hypothetical protein [Vibrio furnissii]WJG24070.1 hypothetical protein QSU95_16415 [Vibrio furnissii]